jgi:nucleoside-diphosphate-sugar epimerase
MGQIFNLGSTRAYSLVQFVELLRRHCTFAVESVPFPDDKKIIDIGDYYGDFSKFQAATGWQPAVDLAEGLERTVAFYREHKEVYWQ